MNTIRHTLVLLLAALALPAAASAAPVPSTAAEAERIRRESAPSAVAVPPERAVRLPSGPDLRPEALCDMIGSPYTGATKTCGFRILNGGNEPVAVATNVKVVCRGITTLSVHKTGDQRFVAVQCPMPAGLNVGPLAAGASTQAFPVLSMPEKGSDGGWLFYTEYTLTVDATAKVAERNETNNRATLHFGAPPP